MERLIIFISGIFLFFLLGVNSAFAIIPDWNAGKIDSLFQSCAQPFTQTIHSVTSAKVPAGNYTVIYQWLMSDIPPSQQTNFSLWQTIQGATSATYNTPALTQSMYYVRRAKLKLCRVVLDSAFTNSCSVLFSPGGLSAVAYTNYSTNICAGNSTILSAAVSQGTTVVWSNGLVGNSITVSAAGTYFFTVSNINGCSAISNNLLVSVGSLPTDLNFDGITELTDFLIFNGHFGNVCSNCQDDFNGDTIVDNFDFLTLLANFNRSCGIPAPSH